MADDVISETVIAGIVGQVETVGKTWGREAAEGHVTERLEAARTRVEGIDVTPIEALAKVDHSVRQTWDASARHALDALDTLIEGTRINLSARAAEAERLTPYATPLTSAHDERMEELTALQAETVWRARLAQMTKAAAVERYRGAHETVQADRRMMAFLESEWKTITFKADEGNDDDQIADMQWRTLSRQRQRARVPKDLVSQLERIEKAQRNATFVTLRGHLHAGRGIALAPKPLELVTPAALAATSRMV